MKEEILELKESILELLNQKKFQQLKNLLNEERPEDLCALFEELHSEINKEEILLLFRLLKKELAADTFIEMDSDTQESLIQAFSDKELKEVLDNIFLDDTVDIIEEMPANVVKRILRQSTPEMRVMINTILKYPPNSAGSIMTIEYVSLKKDMTVSEAFKKIKTVGVDSETIYTCYVTDRYRKLIGLVSVKDMLLADADTVIETLMETNIVSVPTMEDKEEVAKVFSKYHLMALPVVDQEDRLVGIVTYDDAFEVMIEENEEDFSKMAAITPSDKPYLKTSIWRIWLNRVPWLLLLMISATFTGIIISKNEATLAFSITLTACIPMLMDTGGNAGSQASVTIIRGIALNEVKFKDIFRVIWKEIRVSVLLGATLSVACFGKLMLIDRLYLQADGFKIAFVVCLSMFITIVIAKIIGCTLPLLAKKCRLDPAVVASPFITTIVDALSLLVYCSIALNILT